MQCELCEKEFTLTPKQQRNRKFPTLCSHCAIVSANKTKRPKYTPDCTTLEVDTVQCTACDKYGPLPLAMKFDFMCVACHKPYKASILFERTKLHPWHCKSCAISCEWKRDSYRNKHVEELIKAHNRPEEKLRISEQSKARWRDPLLRHRMINNVDRHASAVKLRQTRLKRMLNGVMYKVAHGKRVQFNGQFFRSTYESRFAKLMLESGCEYQYEPKWFVLTSGKAYCPDFYLPSLNLYVETKGWWRDDAKEKFGAFLREYTSTRCALVTKRELEMLERKEMSIEDCVCESNWSSQNV